MVFIANKSSQTGFTLIEVLTATLLTTIFLLVGLQAVVAAVLFKVRAKEKSEAMNRIQEDIEFIRYQAGTLSFTHQRCNAGSAASGFADLFIGDKLSGMGSPKAATYTSPSPFPIGGRTFSLSRTTSVKDTAPYNTIRLSYSVSPTGGSPIATLYTEIVPNAAFRCR